MQKMKAPITWAARMCVVLLSLTTAVLLPCVRTAASAPRQSCGAAQEQLHHTLSVATISLQNPPATYYGPVLPDPGFAPTVGMPVTARIDGTLCGQSETQEVGGQITYAINVQAEGPGGTPGCGTPGRVVTFQVGSQAMVSTARWDNSQLWERPLLRCPDFHGDGAVTVLDIMHVATRWSCTCRDVCYDPLYDLDGDCETTVGDIAKVTAHWGETCE